MDEPTAALSQKEIEELYVLVELLKKDGKAILFISHKFDEIYRIADRYTVFRDGEMVGKGLINDTNQDEIVRLMVGRDVTNAFPKQAGPLGPTVLSVRNYSHQTEFRDISLELRKGEILGLYGLIGAGRSELCQSLFGITRPASGEVMLNGQPLSIRSPEDAIRAGIVYVPEERGRHGLALDMPIYQNMSLPSLTRTSRKGFLAAANEFVWRYFVPPLEEPLRIAGLLWAPAGEYDFLGITFGARNFEDAWATWWKLGTWVITLVFGAANVPYTLKHLRDIGNTVIVVEHDEDAILTADYVVDIGPAAGIHGGQVIAEGSPQEVMANPKSLTGKYLSGELGVAVPAERRKPKKGREIKVFGARGNNLKNVTAAVPLGVFTAVTGVSGGGKSTFLIETLYKSAARRVMSGSRSELPTGTRNTAATRASRSSTIVEGTTLRG